jgi:hypothetical protein
VCGGLERKAIIDLVPRHLDRMIYMDDSGHPKSGSAVYGWIEFKPDHWSSVLRSWLDTGKLLWREYRIAVQTELHTADYVNGRGRISKHIPDRHEQNLAATYPGGSRK